MFFLHQIENSSRFARISLGYVEMSLIGRVWISGMIKYSKKETELCH